MTMTVSVYDDDPENLTLAKLLDLQSRVDELRQVVYYGTTDVIDRGTVFEVTDTFSDDVFLVLHPDDLPTLERQYPLLRFVHLRDKPPMTPNQILNALIRERQKTA